MAVPLAPREEMEFILTQIGVKEAACREETQYLPPTLKEGMVVSRLMVGDGVVVHKKVAKNAERIADDGERVCEEVRPSDSGLGDVIVNTSESVANSGDIKEDVVKGSNVS